MKIKIKRSCSDLMRYTTILLFLYLISCPFVFGQRVVEFNEQADDPEASSKSGVYLEEYFTLNFNGLWLSSDLTSPWYAGDYVDIEDINYYNDFIQTHTQERLGPIGLRVSVSDIDARFAIGLDVNVSRITDTYVHRTVLAGTPGNSNYITGEGYQTTQVKQGKFQSLLFGSFDLANERERFSFAVGLGVGFIAWTDERFASQSEVLNGHVNEISSGRFSASGAFFLKSTWMVHPKFGVVCTLGIGNSILSVGAAQKVSDFVLFF